LDWFDQAVEAGRLAAMADDGMLAVDPVGNSVTLAVAEREGTGMILAVVVALDTGRIAVMVGIEWVAVVLEAGKVAVVLEAGKVAADVVAMTDGFAATDPVQP